MPDSIDSEFVGVVVAAGQARRFRSSLPKQFHDVDGRTVLELAVGSLVTCPDVGGVVVVLAPAELGGRRERIVRALPGVIAVVAGGASRAMSVRAGLAAVGAARFVLVHDAARPSASPGLIRSVIAATRGHGAALPVLEIADTVKRVDAGGCVVETLDRSVLRLAQTPQGSRTDWLCAALDAAERSAAQVTDEASALERDGRRVAVVRGERGNVKITTASDLDRLRAGRGGIEPMNLRVGSGFDIHAIDPERRLVLGGVEFPGVPGLAGHSDADVILHAAMDALLGAAGLGDIGARFPPDDPRFAGAASTDLAAEVSRAVRDRGYTVVNLDLTLLAEAPRIRDRVDEMRTVIAGSFGLDPDRVGLKATTLEKLGALGRREGMAAQAVALLCRDGARD